MAQSVLNNPRRRKLSQKLIQQHNDKKDYNMEQMVKILSKFMNSIHFKNRQYQRNRGDMSKLTNLEQQTDKKQQTFQNKQNNIDDLSKNQHKIKSFQELEKGLEKNNFAEQFRNKISKYQYKKQKRSSKQGNKSNKSIQTKKLNKQDKFFKLQSAHVAISFKIYLQNCQKLSLYSPVDPTLNAKKLKYNILKGEHLKKSNQSLSKQQENINEQENHLQIQNQSKYIKIIPQTTIQSKKQLQARNYFFTSIPKNKKMKNIQMPNRSQLQPIQSQQIEQSQQKSENIEHKGKKNKR